MSTQKIKMAETGYKKCQEELKKLYTETRPKIISELRIAYDYGDLRENSEFDAAKEAQRQCENRIKTLEKMLENAIILPKNNTTKITIGSKVTIEYIETKEQETYQIVNAI